MSRRPTAAGPDTVAKILYTSGSTGQPKGVINTQRMLCSNQEMLRTVLPLLADEPPVLCDWLPWNHTFGGNHNFGIVLYNNGTLYIDDGRPTPEGFETTVANLREIASTAYFNVPRRLRSARAAAARRPRVAGSVLQPAADAVLCRRGASPAGGRRSRPRGRRGARGTYSARDRARRDRERAVRALRG